MALQTYNEKRNFKETTEPEGKPKEVGKELRFVVQKHHATQLHYDFRLELDGVLVSWAVPKGPSLDPSIKRLAMMVEDHPVDYINFEGTIPEGNYGAGEVIVWDTGTYSAPDSKTLEESIQKLHEGLEKGDLKFILEGKKLKGSFVLVKIKNRFEKSGKNNTWLLMKHKDEFISTEDILKDTKSVLSDKSLE